LQIRIPIIRRGDPIREFRIDGDLPSQGPQRRYSVHHERKPRLAGPRRAWKKSIELRVQLSLEIGVARDLVDDVAIPPAHRRVFGAQRAAVDGHAVVDEVQGLRWDSGEYQAGSQTGQRLNLYRHLAQSWEAARTGFAREIRVEGRDLCRVDGRPIPILAQQIHGVGQLERSAVAGCRVYVDCGLEFQQKIERLGSFAAQPLIAVRQGLPREKHFPGATLAECSILKRAPESAAGGECSLQHIESGRARQIPRTVELPCRERVENLPVARVHVTGIVFTPVGNSRSERAGSRLDVPAARQGLGYPRGKAESSDGVGLDEVAQRLPQRSASLQGTFRRPW
jgi:hypothetical protein